MLRITLRDGEKTIVNGAVLRAVGRVQICLENNAAILRGRDVMKPEEATTLARQLYFACMLAYIDPEGRPRHQDTLLTLLAAIMPGAGPELQTICIRFAGELAAGDFYRGLAAARALIAIEDQAASAQAA